MKLAISCRCCVCVLWFFLAHRLRQGWFACLDRRNRPSNRDAENSSLRIFFTGSTVLRATTRRGGGGRKMRLPRYGTTLGGARLLHVKPGTLCVVMENPGDAWLALYEGTTVARTGLAQ